MYPLLCSGGYGVPMKRGKFEILKITAACSSSSAEARMQLCDSRRVSPSSKTPAEHLICDLKRVAACDANIIFDCPEPIKIRNGLAPLILTNLVVGSIIVYIR